MPFSWKGLANVGLNIGIPLLQSQGGKAATVGNILTASMASIQNVSQALATPLTGDQKAALVIQTITSAVQAEAAALGKSVTLNPVVVQDAVTAVAALENMVAAQLHGA